MVFASIIVYILFGLGFAAGYCSSREARGNTLYELVLWLAAIVAWPMGLGLFTGGWLAKYWPDHPTVEPEPGSPVIEFHPAKRIYVSRTVTRSRGAE